MARTRHARPRCWTRSAAPRAPAGTLASAAASAARGITRRRRSSAPRPRRCLAPGSPPRLAVLGVKLAKRYPALKRSPRAPRGCSCSWLSATTPARSPAGPRSATRSGRPCTARAQVSGQVKHKVSYLTTDEAARPNWSPHSRSSFEGRPGCRTANVVSSARRHDHTCQLTSRSRLRSRLERRKRILLTFPWVFHRGSGGQSPASLSIASAISAAGE